MAEAGRTREGPNGRQQLAGLERRIGLLFRDPDLLLQAVTHTSFVNEHREMGISSNERLEFLGDAVLELVISHYVFERFPDLPEGDLTRLRAAVVREATLARAAASLGLGEYLLLGKGEETSGGRERPSLLADVFEALVGALFVDRGLAAAERFIKRVLGPDVEAAAAGAYVPDYKTALQELTQNQYAARLQYQVEAEEGPDHDKTFQVVVGWGGRILGRGRGKSKKEAEQEAARIALERLAVEE